MGSTLKYLTRALRPVTTLAFVACSPAAITTPDSGTVGTPLVDSGADNASQVDSGDASDANYKQDSLVQCPTRTHDRVGIVVGPYSGATYECSLAGMLDGGRFPYGADLAFEGTVASVGNSLGDAGANVLHVDVDTCQTDGGCANPLVGIDVTAPMGMPRVPIKVGSFVSVEYHLSVSFGCAQGITLRQVAQVAGIVNSVAPKDALLLMASDGFVPPSPSESMAATASPGINVVREPEGCAAPANGCGSVPADDYALRFLQNGNNADGGVLVRMGQPAASWMVGQQSIYVMNLRSYQTAVCDDYTNWAYLLGGI
jgi:hypothetical protein